MILPNVPAKYPKGEAQRPGGEAERRAHTASTGKRGQPPPRTLGRAEFNSASSKILSSKSEGPTPGPRGPGAPAMRNRSHWPGRLLFLVVAEGSHRASEPQASIAHPAAWSRGTSCRSALLGERATSPNRPLRFHEEPEPSQGGAESHAGRRIIVPRCFTNGARFRLPASRQALQAPWGQAQDRSTDP
jgi:hypothetical protein